MYAHAVISEPPCPLPAVIGAAASRCRSVTGIPGSRFFMDWARVMTALDAVPVVSERPTQQDASWPSRLHAAAFATTMKGAIMRVKPANLGGDATYAVVEKAVDGERVSLTPQLSSSPATPVTLDERVDSYIPSLLCADDERRSDGAGIATEFGTVHLLGSKGEGDVLLLQPRLADAGVRHGRPASEVPRLAHVQTSARQ